MGYIIVLVIALALFFSGPLMHLPISGWLDKTQSNIVDSLAPRSEREIIIENLQKKAAIIQTTLKKQAAATGTSASEKPSISEINAAIEAVRESETLLEALQDTQDKPSLGGVVIQKVITSLSNDLPGNTPDAMPSVPPQCQIVCPE